eukprot:6181388-Pleurochrysis_carterae.AAC.1
MCVCAFVAGLRAQHRADHTSGDHHIAWRSRAPLRLKCESRNASRVCKCCPHLRRSLRLSSRRLECAAALCVCA